VTLIRYSVSIGSLFLGFGLVVTYCCQLSLVRRLAARRTNVLHAIGPSFFLTNFSCPCPDVADLCHSQPYFGAVQNGTLFPELSLSYFRPDQTSRGVNNSPRRLLKNSISDQLHGRGVHYIRRRNVYTQAAFASTGPAREDSEDSWRCLAVSDDVFENKVLVSAFVSRQTVLELSRLLRQ